MKPKSYRYSIDQVSEREKFFRILSLTGIPRRNQLNRRKYLRFSPKISFVFQLKNISWSWRALILANLSKHFTNEKLFEIIWRFAKEEFEQCSRRLWKLKFFAAMRKVLFFSYRKMGEGKFIIIYISQKYTLFVFPPNGSLWENTNDFFFPRKREIHFSSLISRGKYAKNTSIVERHFASLMQCCVLITFLSIVMLTMKVHWWENYIKRIVL